MSAFNNREQSKTVETITIQPLSVSSTPANNESKNLTMASASSYAIGTAKLRGVLCFNADNTVDGTDKVLTVEVTDQNGAFVTKKTYTSGGFKEDLIFETEVGQEIKIDFSLPANASEKVVNLEYVRLQVQTSNQKDCNC